MGEIRQAQVTSLKKGSYVILDGIACIVREIQSSRPGKHGHTKCRIEAIGMINGQKKIVIKPGHEKIDVPIVEKKTAQVLSISGDTANVMDVVNYETFDLKIPEELKKDIKEGSQVLYWVILDQKVIKQVK